MSFEISCFGLVWDLFQFTIEGFRTIRPISGWDGRLSPFDGLLWAPTVLTYGANKQLLKNRNLIFWQLKKQETSEFKGQNLTIVYFREKGSRFSGKSLRQSPKCLKPAFLPIFRSSDFWFHFESCGPILWCSRCSAWQLSLLPPILQFEMQLNSNQHCKAISETPGHALQSV